jgi:hypothetical protein
MYTAIREIPPIVVGAVYSIFEKIHVQTISSQPIETSHAWIS